MCVHFLLYFRIAETDTEVKLRLQKWNKFLESGEDAAEHTSEENKGRIDVIEQNVSSANIKGQEGITKNAGTNSEWSEKTNEDVVDRHMRVKQVSKAEKLEDGVEGSRSIVVE
jgi:hypothetical protein